MADMAVAQLAEQRRQYENRIDDLKEASDQRARELMRTITALAEQVDFLRAKHYGGVQPSTGEPPSWQMPSQEPIDAIAEASALHAGGHLDDDDFSAALEQIRRTAGLRSPIQIEP